MLEQIDALGIASNTYVLFTTDHGTPGRNPPLTGGKGGIYEGGLRVPFVIRGPCIQPGICCSVRATGLDLFPTIVELARVVGPMPAGVEGGSLVPVLTHAGQGTVQRPREEFVLHFPHYDKDALGPASALWLGDYKLVRAYETGGLRLFNLKSDPGEKKDLSAAMPDETKELDRLLTEYLAAVGARMPRENPDFDPTQKAPQTSRGGKRKAR